MTSDAKRALSKAIRGTQSSGKDGGLRDRLINDHSTEAERRFRFSIPVEKASLSEADRIHRARLDSWLDEQVRSLPKKQRKDARDRFLADLVKTAASTLLNRIVYLRLLEAAGIRRVMVVSEGWQSRGYRDFREFAPQIVEDDESEGYATLLRLIFEDLSVELPGLYANDGLVSLIPVPVKTLRDLIEALANPELESCWTDDMTLGWIYQYWNDPDREALDDKLNERGKIENHEIASKTQMFTERYMVEWLLHNTLGQTWLAICAKNKWTPTVKADGTLDGLEERRTAWRLRRAAGEVEPDALLPLESDAERRWAYWVPQPLPQDAPGFAPQRLEDLKLLDPACGSGHFLVIACDLLFALYEEQAQHLGQAFDADETVQTILERNLHGIDIDPRAVQIAAAALALKAAQLAPNAHFRHLNLVAPQLRLASLSTEDPARVELCESVQRETGIPTATTEKILSALAGADHLGTLLRVDAAIDDALNECERLLVAPEVNQHLLFGSEEESDERVAIDPALAKATLLERLDAFLNAHTNGNDLGLRLRGEQLAIGVRFVQMVQESQYDIVVGNPPYQGTSKMADATYIAKQYPKGKADLFAAFLERGLELVKEGGTSALLTMRNWMFIKQYQKIREWLVEKHDLRVLGDVDRGAFDEVPNEILAAVMSVFRRTTRASDPSVAMQPTPLDDKSYDRQRTKRKRAAVLAQVGRFEFSPADLRVVEGSPLIYWWSREVLKEYAETPKLGKVAPAKQGVSTADNNRFVRRPWEVHRRFDIVDARVRKTRVHGHDPYQAWHPFIKGPAGAAWIEPIRWVVRWSCHGLEICNFNRDGRQASVVRNPALYFRPGVAFSMIGASFAARLHRTPSIIADMGSSIYPDDQVSALCLLNSKRARLMLSDLNPTVHFQQSDVDRLPIRTVANADEIVARLVDSFLSHERAREASVEFVAPRASSWEWTQDWAQQLVDSPMSSQSLSYEPVTTPAQSIDFISFAVGIALGRFGHSDKGILDSAPATALPHGILFVSSASETDSLVHDAAKPVCEAWSEHGSTIDAKRTLKEWLQQRFFADVHVKMYEQRPIYFPLSSQKSSFVAFVAIHRWTLDTLRALLAEHLHPALAYILGALGDLEKDRGSSDRSAASAAEKRREQLVKWRDELIEFIANVEQCAEKGPPPPDAKTPEREVDARYDPDLDDGVMINSAALWPLLEPQWKDPKKWWKELALAKGRKDYDWAHLSARYFPTRVDEKCQADPSLAVAHGCFWRYHPARAYKWELRLKNEIGQDFTLDESGSDDARAAFEHDYPDQVKELRSDENKRHLRKQEKAKKGLFEDGVGSGKSDNSAAGAGEKE